MWYDAIGVKWRACNVLYCYMRGGGGGGGGHNVQYDGYDLTFLNLMEFVWRNLNFFYLI